MSHLSRTINLWSKAAFIIALSSSWVAYGAGSMKYEDTHGRGGAEPSPSGGTDPYPGGGVTHPYDPSDSNGGLLPVDGSFGGNGELRLWKMLIDEHRSEVTGFFRVNSFRGILFSVDASKVKMGKEHPRHHFLLLLTNHGPIAYHAHSTPNKLSFQIKAMVQNRLGVDVGTNMIHSFAEELHSANSKKDLMHQKGLFLDFTRIDKSHLNILDLHKHHKSRKGQGASEKALGNYFAQGAPAALDLSVESLSDRLEAVKGLDKFGFSGIVHLLLLAKGLSVEKRNLELRRGKPKDYQNKIKVLRENARLVSFGFAAQGEDIGRNEEYISSNAILLLKTVHHLGFL